MYKRQTEDRVIRGVSFFSGCTPRQVEKFLKAKSLVALNSLFADESPQGRNTLTIYGTFWNELNQAMVDRNRGLLEKLSNHGAVDLDKICDIEWDKTFVPLEFPEAGVIWRRVHPERDPASAHTALLHLADRGWLVLDGVHQSAPKSIYPFSMAHLIRQLQPPPSFAAAFQKVLQSLEITGKLGVKVPMPGVEMNAEVSIKKPSR